MHYHYIPVIHFDYHLSLERRCCKNTHFFYKLNLFPKKILNKSFFYLVDWSFFLIFAADKHNSITKQINWSKNEENDNGCKQLPSGSILCLVVRWGCALWDCVSRNVCASAKLKASFRFAFGLSFLDILLQLFGWCDRVTPTKDDFIYT